MKKLLTLLFLLSVPVLFSQPRPKDVVEKAPTISPEGNWSWSGAAARLAIPHGNSFPLTNLEDGSLFYRTDIDSFYYYTGSEWKSTSSGNIQAILDSLSAHSDSLAAHRDLLDAHSDSLSAHSDSLAAHSDSLSAHSSLLSQHSDSIDAHSDSLSENTKDIYNLFRMDRLTGEVGSIKRPTITDLGNGSVRISAGVGVFKVSNDDTTTSVILPWSQRDIALTDSSLSYLVIRYNGGSPIPGDTLDHTLINGETEFEVGIAYRKGTDIDIAVAPLDVSGFDRDEFERVRHRGIERMSGVIVAETGERYLTLTDGIFYYGITEIPISAQNTSTGDVFKYYYRKATSGKWEKVTAQTQINNTLYDDGSGTPATLTAGRYGVWWIYVCLEGEMYAVMGQGNYTLANAQAASAPSSIPDYLDKFAVLAAKVLVLKNATNLYSISSAYTTVFPVNSAPDHNDMGGLQGGTTEQYYHLTSAQIDSIHLINSLGSALGTTGTYKGETIILTAGENVVFGEVCYIKSDGKAWLADADSSTTMPGMFMAVASISADASGLFLKSGRVRLDTWNWSPGGSTGILYPSTTKRNMTHSPPDGAGDQVQALGIALTTDEMLFDPYPILVEIQ